MFDDSQRKSCPRGNIKKAITRLHQDKIDWRDCSTPSPNCWFDGNFIWKMAILLCSPLRFILKNLNLKTKEREKQKKKAIGKSTCKTRSPNKCKKKQLENAKKKQTKKQMQKKSNWKKQKKKAKKSKQKAKTWFSFFLHFFRKTMQKKSKNKAKKKQQKSNLFFAFSVAFFLLFVFAFFLLFSEVRFPGVHFWFAYLLLYFCIFFKRLIYRIKLDPDRITILLMEEIRGSPVGVGSFSHYLQGLIHPRWCRISSINSSILHFSRDQDPPLWHFIVLVCSYIPYHGLFMIPSIVKVVIPYITKPTGGFSRSLLILLANNAKPPMLSPHLWKRSLRVAANGRMVVSPRSSKPVDQSLKIQVLLMEEILHQLVCSFSHCLQGFIHPRWCRISSINSMF